MNPLHPYLGVLPLVAIVRGIRPHEAAAVGRALLEHGFRCIEVPLNSPEPFDSIAELTARYGERALIGAGTVLDTTSVDRVAEAGGRLVVAPNLDVGVVRHAVASGLACVPGVATPSEAFAALGAGAHALKMFPAETLPPAAVKAWRAVLPGDAILLPVGGIVPGSMTAYIAGGASGFGLGSALYRPGMGPDEVGERAAAFVAAWDAIARAG